MTIIIIRNVIQPFGHTLMNDSIKTFQKNIQAARHSQTSDFMFYLNHRAQILTEFQTFLQKLAIKGFKRVQVTTSRLLSMKH